MGSVWLARRSDGRFEGQRRPEASEREPRRPRRARSASAAKARSSPGSRIPISRVCSTPASLHRGQPYLVLEHVDGEPIDLYCDRRRLDIEARLRLFLDVAEAVSLAHANLVVHRDIKPSNVLVDAGRPRQASRLRHRQASRGRGRLRRRDRPDPRGRPRLHAGVRGARAAHGRRRSRRDRRPRSRNARLSPPRRRRIRPAPRAPPRAAPEGHRRYRPTPPVRGGHRGRRRRALDDGGGPSPPASRRPRHDRDEGPEEGSGGALPLGRRAWPTMSGDSWPTSRSEPGRIPSGTARPSSFGGIGSASRSRPSP